MSEPSGFNPIRPGYLCWLLIVLLDEYGTTIAYVDRMAEIIFDSLKYKKELEMTGVPNLQAEKHVEIMGKIINTHLATKEDIKIENLALRSDMANESAAIRKEMAVEFASVRSEMAAEFAAVRSEMAAEFAAVRSEMAAEFAAVRSEMAAEFKAVRSEINNAFTEQGKLIATYFMIATGILGILITILGFSLK